MWPAWTTRRPGAILAEHPVRRVLSLGRGPATFDFAVLVTKSEARRQAVQFNRSQLPSGVIGRTNSAGQHSRRWARGNFRLTSNRLYRQTQPRISRAQIPSSAAAVRGFGNDLSCGALESVHERLRSRAASIRRGEAVNDNEKTCARDIRCRVLPHQTSDANRVNPPVTGAKVVMWRVRHSPGRFPRRPAAEFRGVNGSIINSTRAFRRSITVMMCPASRRFPAAAVCVRRGPQGLVWPPPQPRLQGQTPDRQDCPRAR